MEKKTKKDCDCLEKVKESIIKRENESETNPKDYKIIKAGWEHISWYPKRRLYADFIINNTFTKKDGTTSKPKKEHISIFFTYCPFCGKKYPK